MYWKRTTHSSIVNVNDNIKRVNNLFRANRCITVRAITKILQIGIGSVETIINKKLKKMNAHGILQISINETKVYVYK